MKHGVTLSVFAVITLSGGFQNALAFDDEARAILKKNDCVKCHAPEKEKRGPSLKKMASRYAGKPAEGESQLIKAMQSSDKVKLSDGTEEFHKVLDVKDAATLRNLARWILAQ